MNIKIRYTIELTSQITHRENKELWNKDWEFCKK